jgi:VWFA-related protein
MRAALTIAYLLALGQAPQGPPIRSGVTLVTVDVTVVDADGRPVPNLTAADFEIRLNNRVQPIRGFGYLQVADTSMAGAVGPSFDAAPAAPAAAAGGGIVPRTFVVLVDDLSFSPLGGRNLLAAAQRFIAALPATDVVGLTSSSGTVVVNPTANRAALLAALPRIAGAFQDPRVATSGPAEGKYTSPDQQVGFAQALAIDRGETIVLRDAIVNECFGGDPNKMPFSTIEDVLAHNTCAIDVKIGVARIAAQLKALVRRQAAAFEAAIRAMGIASGIRHLLVLTDGIALAQDVSEMQPVARAAAETGVQVTVVMNTPDNVSATDTGRRPELRGEVDTGLPQRRREDNALLLDGARTTTGLAGGELLQVTGDPDRVFQRVAVAASGIYRIAVEAPSNTAPGKDFALAVRVPKRARMTVRANRHAVAVSPTATPVPTTAPAAPKPVAAGGGAPTLPLAGEAAPKPASTSAGGLVPPEEQIRRAIASGRALDGFPITLDSTLRRADDPAQVAIDVVIDIGAGAKAPVATMFGLVDAAGAIRTSSRTIADSSGYHLAFRVPVAAGVYRLRFAAADASGAVAAIESPVTATLTTLGPLQASGIGVQPLAGGGRGVLAGIDLYPAAGATPADLVVKMALLSPSGEVVVERVIVPEDDNGVWRAEAEFALDRQPPGAYTVRATVLSGVTVLGTLTRQIR